MSYGLRNTIILLVTLLVIVSIGFSFSYFYLDKQIVKLEGEVKSKQTDFNSKQTINQQFDQLNSKYEVALEVMSNYDKVLYPSSKPDDVYDFLSSVDQLGGNKLTFDFTFTDSLPNSEYGIINSSLTGFGSYESLTNFVNRIENSQLLNKVNGLIISPAPQEDDLNLVNFTFDMESYYEKVTVLDTVNSGSFEIKMNEDVSTYNPLYPLVQEKVQPNVDNLPDARSSKLIGITENRIFIKTQDGRITSLKVNDRVYLGYLSRINPDNKSATFNLNLGGIQEVVTLEVQR